MKLIRVLCLYIVCGSVNAQTSVAPENPILIVTEIGEVATTTGRLRVVVSATLTASQITTSIDLKDLDHGTALSIDPKDAPAMMELLERASIAASNGKLFSGNAGKLSATIRTAGEKQWLLLKFDDKGGGSVSQQYLIDAQSTTRVARVLAQGKQASDWFIEKLKLIQPEPIIR